MGVLSPFRRYPPVAVGPYGVVVWFEDDRVHLVDVPSPALDAAALLPLGEPEIEAPSGLEVFHSQLAWPSRGLAAHVSKADGSVRALHAFGPLSGEASTRPGSARRRGRGGCAVDAPAAGRRPLGVPRLRARRARGFARRLRGRVDGARRRAVGAAGDRRLGGGHVPGAGAGGQGRTGRESLIYYHHEILVLAVCAGVVSLAGLAGAREPRRRRARNRRVPDLRADRLPERGLLSRTAGAARRRVRGRARRDGLPGFAGRRAARAGAGRRVGDRRGDHARGPPRRGAGAAPGVPLVLYVAAYGIARFALEEWRGDAGRRRCWASARRSGRRSS